MLECYRYSRRESVAAGVAGMLIMVVVSTLLSAGFSWVSQWWAWAIILGVGSVLFRQARTTYLAAGADWLQTRRNWVRIYELSTITCSTKLTGCSIWVRDRAGRSAGCALWDLQTNPALWDLVYNGILHSVASIEVRSNATARRHLPLPNEVGQKIRENCKNR